MIRIRSGDTVTELAWTGENIPAARLLAQAGLYPDYPCGGQGRCGKCRVLAHGDLSPAAPEELAQLPPRELARGMRLACLARICGPDAELTLPREDGLLVETGGSLHRLEWDPWAAALGICVDIGTTTVAAYLWDLDRRCRLGVASCKTRRSGSARTWCPVWTPRWRVKATPCAPALSGVSATWPISCADR